MFERADKTRREEQSVNRRRRIIRCVRLPRFQINDFEFCGVGGAGDDVEGLVAGLAAVVGVFDLNEAAARILYIEDLYPVVVPHQQIGEVFRAIAGYFINLEVKAVLVALGNAPGNLGADLFLRSIDHVKLFVVLDAHYKFVGRIFDTPGYIALRKISLREAHHQFKRSTFRRVSLQFTKEHSVIATETNFAFARGHNNVKDCIDLERLGLKHLAHVVHFNYVNVTKVLSKDQKFLLDAIVLILKKLDIIDTLLQLLIVFFLKSVYIEDEKMAIIATDPCQVVVHSAAEKTVAGRLLHDNRAELLVIHVQLVPLASRKY